MLAIHHLPEVFDPRWIFSAQKLRQVFNRPDNRAGVPFEGRFAPAEESRLIRFDFDEDPVSHPRVTDEGADGGDFHAEKPTINRTFGLLSTQMFLPYFSCINL